MRGPTSLKLSSLLCEKEPMQQGSRHQRRRRSKTSWSSISTCDGSAMRSNTSWSSLSTCDGLSDSSRCSEADSENDHLSVLAVLSIRPPPGLPVPLEWIEFARALKAQQGIPQQVQCSVHVEPAPVVGAGKQKPFKKHHFVTYFTLYDPEKHQAFELISRIIGKKTDPKGSDNMKTDPKGSDNMKTDPKGSDNMKTDPKGSDNMKTDPKGSDNMKTDPKGSDNMKTDPKASQKGSDNMKAIFNQGKGIRIHVQGRGVKRAQIGWPHGYEVEELHIYCACPSEELKVKAIAKLCEILDPLSNHFHFFRRKLGGEKIEYNRSEPFYIIVEAPELRG